MNQLVVDSALVDCWAYVADPGNWVGLASEFPVLKPLVGRGPQAGYVGEGYLAGGCLFMGQNPRLTDSLRGYKTGDDELYRLQEVMVERRDRESFDALMRFQKEFMRGWDIFRAIDFPPSFGLDWSEVAYVNSCQCPTTGNRFSKRVWRACNRLFLSQQVALLRPGKVVFFGKSAYDISDDLCPEIPSDWIPHPTGTYSKVNPKIMRDQLASCIRFVTG